MKADIQITFSGLALISGLSKRGLAWIRRNVAYESWQDYGGSIASEPNYARDIAEGARADGLIVETI